jgi:hypothetical protein
VSAPETLFLRGMSCWPVSARVGNIRNNDPSAIEPIAAGRSFVVGVATAGAGEREEHGDQRGFFEAGRGACRAASLDPLADQRRRPVDAVASAMR